jgi:hypothetical protein
MRCSPGLWWNCSVQSPEFLRNVGFADASPAGLCVLAHAARAVVLEKSASPYDSLADPTRSDSTVFVILQVGRQGSTLTISHRFSGWWRQRIKHASELSGLSDEARCSKSPSSFSQSACVSGFRILLG